MSNLVVFQPQNLEETMKLGGVLAKSGFFNDAKQEAQAVVKVLAGAELGFGPVQSMNNIYIINGRIAISAHLMANAVKRSKKYNYKINQLDNTACRIEFFENGQSVGESPFTIQDAKQAGTKNINTFPRNMLFARAMSNGVRWYCPDIFSGPVYTPDEFVQTENGAEVIDAGEPVYVNQSTGEVVDGEIVENDYTNAAVYEYYAATDRANEYGLNVELLSGDVSADLFEPASKKINQHCDLWERFANVLVVIAEEMGVLDHNFDLEASRTLSYDDLLASAKHLAEDIKAPVRQKMGAHAPKSPKIEDWAKAWRDLNGEAAF